MSLPWLIDVAPELSQQAKKAGVTNGSRITHIDTIEVNKYTEDDLGKFLETGGDHTVTFSSVQVRRPFINEWRKQLQTPGDIIWKQEEEEWMEKTRREEEARKLEAAVTPSTITWDLQSKNHIVTGDRVTQHEGYPQSGSTLARPAISSGRHEFSVVCINGGRYLAVGFAPAGVIDLSGGIGLSGDLKAGYAYHGRGSKYHNGSGTPYSKGYQPYHVVTAVADLDAGEIIFKVNGIDQGVAYWRDRPEHALFDSTTTSQSTSTQTVFMTFQMGFLFCGLQSITLTSGYLMLSFYLTTF